jgi:uncharacterized protein with HEPN domain
MSATPPDRVAGRLEDILDCIAKIRRYVSGYDLDRFVEDDKTRDAVVWNLQTIGEAARHLPPDLKSTEPAIPWQDILGARNVFAHDYDSIDEAIVWKIVSGRLDDLEAAIRRMLVRCLGEGH